MFPACSTALDFDRALSLHDWQSHVIIDIMKKVNYLYTYNATSARPLLKRTDEWCDLHLKPGPGRPFGDWSEGWWWDWFAVRALRAEAESLLTRPYRDLPIEVFSPDTKNAVRRTWVGARRGQAPRSRCDRCR
jgi:hypothetical protein